MTVNLRVFDIYIKNVTKTAFFLKNGMTLESTGCQVKSLSISLRIQLDYPKIK